ncbi:MAG: tetratricopeptide repeat protein [Planctomycetota bacterium]|jgi:hypothetical protein
MEKERAEKTPKVAPKSFMTVGPTLHYSHKNVQRCWLLAFLVFISSCLLWSKMQTGSLWPYSLQALECFQKWHLGGCVVSGVSIFEYPWQIIVLGLLMGILAIVPALVSQLMKFKYSLLFILMVLFLAGLPGLAVCLLISCIAVACRPLRFRSRFISIALCTTPQLIYWGFWGGAKGVEPIKWGFSYAPWIFAWLVCLAIAGVVLGIGHFTRYRPGLIWIVTAVELLTVAVLFEVMIGFAELDYQLYVAKNNPEYVSEFHDHSIAETLNKTITNPDTKDLLTAFFYPEDQIQLRTELRREIQDELESRDNWPRWFKVRPELDYQDKRKWLFGRYDLFIKNRPNSKRMPIALYYKALLSEYSPDIKMLGQKEMLHFYNDYPYERSRQIWYRLYSRFGSSPESIEARWRIAIHWARQHRFKEANDLLVEAEIMAMKYLRELESKPSETETIFSLFHPPADSVVTVFKLNELQRRIERLRRLINESQTDSAEGAEKLAKFIMLNPYSSGYEWYLDELLEGIKKNNPLCSSMLLAKADLIPDEQLRIEKLSLIHKQFPDTYGGMQALYELGRLNISLWRHTDESNPEQKKKYLNQARAVLEKYITLYQDSSRAEQAKGFLKDLPEVK